MTTPHVADSTFRTWPQDDFLLPPPNPAHRLDATTAAPASRSASASPAPSAWSAWSASSDAPTVPCMPAVPVPCGLSVPSASSADSADSTNPEAPAASVLDPRDLRRIELNAALTAAGIAPLPGDREAIDQLSALPHSVHEALHRWLTS
ncbi:hypothetical protein QIS96_14465 [Streptomyces sp. B-S-A6]|uniref:Uncharacterized protein n=2 Tax=Streptomyces cavernicola TaxID=3043613 RepID=A0ABT6SA03_9ACTN|nr:hypothetical protein [Streptomyces sp. B-S-A6]MDI3405016.1 hypothetical protein [Streptomyces sp. B-S-A6]